MYRINVKTDSGSEPVTQAEIVNYIKYDESDATELTLINSLVKSARELIEKYLNVSLKSKTYTLEFDSEAVDDYRLNIPYSPFVSLTSLTQYDNEGTSTALTQNTNFYLRGAQMRQLYFPEIETDYYYVMEYISGYSGSGVETLPDVLKNAIMKQVKVWYDREFTNKLDPEVIGMIQPYSKQFWI